MCALFDENSQQNVKLNVVCALKVKIQSKYKASEEEEDKINEEYKNRLSFFSNRLSSYP